MLTITNEDNMALMARYPDKYFDLAIVDPPYGIEIHKMNYTQNTKGGVAKRKDYSSVGNWDCETPKKEYFNELFRVSKNQVIWGGGIILI
jgi:site-specific DNA-methyltransferase (adenine-specific)